MSDDPTKSASPGARSRSNLVALGTAAVLTVYGAGYLRTQAAAELLEGDDLERPVALGALPSPGARAPAVGPASASRPAASSGTDAPSGAVPSTGASSEAAADGAPFRDGSYKGLGRSRHGNIEATVEVTDGRIVSATITSCKTLYPCSRIDEIVPQVVERQDSWVDNVSGATVSVTAFYRAVVQALKQAQ